MRVLITCICLASLAAPRIEAGNGHGQETASARLAWLVCAGIPDDLENPVKVATGKDLVEVTLSKRSASQGIRIPEDGVLRVLRPVRQAAGTVESGFRTLALTRIPEDVGHALVILLPVAEQADGRLFECRVQDLADFKGGDWLYLNLTHLDIRIETDGSQLRIVPGQYEIHHAPDLDKAVSTAFSYSYYDPGKQQWKPLAASSVVLSPTRREICIFSIDPRSERITSHGITLPVSDPKKEIGN